MAARAGALPLGSGDEMPDGGAAQLDFLLRSIHQRAASAGAVSEDAAEASHIFTLLMGDKVGPRRSFIVEESRRLGLGDLDV